MKRVCLLLLLVSGCAADIQIGTGEHVFKELSDGTTLPISCGMAGEKFIVGAVRTQTLAPENADVVVQIKTKDTDDLVCHEAIDAAQLATVDGWQQYTGIHCFVDELSGLNGRTVTMTGAIRDANGTSASTSVTFKLSAPESGCGG